MYKIPQLLKYKNLFHAFSEKDDGNMANAVSGVVCDFDQVMENRKRFLEKVEINIDKTVCMWVRQGDEIIEADTKLAGVSVKDYTKAVKVDGLITNKKGLYLFLLIADCLPIIIYDPVAQAVALVHAGWKGVDLEIAKKAVEMLKSKYKSNSKDLVIGIGPCVYKESFIKENPLQKDDPRWKGFMKDLENKRYAVDLVGFTKKQLTDSGVLENNIYESGIDTAKDERFFSYIREGKLSLKFQGRFACIVGLR